uniref:WRKY transcription factor n=1 Tax=Bruguiera gymnorhiza TaxID=39984 RepID=B1Q4U9_BRUGY|nr:WRKY transcription factor [Bruguiera gymnorhiza]
MENGWSWEQRTLISELSQGMKLAKQLRLHLTAASSVETRDLLLQRILSSYENSLSILNWSGSTVHPQTVRLSAGVPESPLSINGSPRSDDFDRGLGDNPSHNDASKKRKTMPRWTDQVRVSSENGLEGPHDDGYSWRKYGQKDILGAKYPRSYYRCTYRNTQNCWATKQVQRSHEDPTVFDVTYRGAHTCSHGRQSVPAPASPEKLEQEQTNNNYSSQQQQSQQAFPNIGKGLSVNTQELDNKELPSPFSFPSAYGFVKSVSSHSPPFISPATPEPYHSSFSPFQMDKFGGFNDFQSLESDYPEIISANTSATNSPIVDLDFSLDMVKLDPNFPFDTPGFS